MELPVDYRKAKRILKFLGYKVRATYSKKREEYRLLSCSVVVDHLSRLGWFVEVEGKPKAIRRASKLLNLPASAREPRSYLALLYGRGWS
jgi:adenylate cyclase class IV